MIISIDFDGTLFPTLEKAISIYNNEHNTNLLLNQITTYNLYECLDTSVADELLNIFLDKEVYNKLQPYKGSIQAIEKMVNQGHRVYIATATDSKNLEWKEKLLHTYFPFIPKDNIIKIIDKSLLNCDILIDDCMGQLTKTSAERICIDHTWNQNKSKDYIYDIYRCKSWLDVTKAIDDIERKWNTIWN